MLAPGRPVTVTTDPSRQIADWQSRAESALERRLPPEASEPHGLHSAMRYAALAGGKRFRPVLVYAAGAMLKAPAEPLDAIAAAIEFIHAYSLVHDDLPAMDDDTLRRGRPTCHIAFNEATAILAGDALQALAFEVLAAELPADRPSSLAIVYEIARACGSLGMAGGQELDLSAVGRTLAPEGLVRMHRLKTGALIQASVTTPCLLAGSDATTRERMAEFGACVGLAFQVHDDILDVTGDSERIGKSTLADAARDKPTFVSILGLDESRKRARDLRDQAIASLQDVPGDTRVLQWLADYVIRRDR